MQSPFEKESPEEYYKLLDAIPEGAKQVVGSKMSEEKLGRGQRDPVTELRMLCEIYEGYKQTGETSFISKAEDYLAAWSWEYNPDTQDKGIQISLDQRYFSWVFIETLDCWDALSEEGRKSASILAQKVVSEEEKFWSQNTKLNNRFSYSTLTRIVAYDILKADGNDETHANQERAINDFYRQVRENVYEDGSTTDFRERDSVHYQVFNQIAWEITRKYLQEHAVAIPEDVIDKLNAALNFCLKFINGNEEHIEFVHSTHVRDKEIQDDKVGKPFDKNSYVSGLLIDIVGKE